MVVETEDCGVEKWNALFAAACAAQEQGDLEKAKENYCFLIEKFPGAPILHYNLGLVFFEEEHFAEAAASFSQAASLAEDDLDILFNLALAYKKQGDIAAAIRGFHLLLSKDPQMVDALYSLGGCYRQAGEVEQAIACYRQVIEVDKEFLPAHNTLAYLYHKTGKKELAISHYRQVLAQNPDHENAEYMLSALQGGEGVSAPPADYVRDMFDDYASHFEKSLVGELQYRVPGLLRGLCDTVFPSGFSATHMLDLGCGTGLSGVAFADVAERLSGVDISSKMLEIAAEKGIYNELATEDIVQFLSSDQQKYSFFLACDVLNYFGELEQLFSEIAASGEPGSLLCFSTEMQEKEGFGLRETGRFAHNPVYIRALLTTFGYTLLAEEEAVLRKERGEWVSGILWLAQLSVEEKTIQDSF